MNSGEREQEYYCPNHPNYHSAGPGLCPVITSKGIPHGWRLKKQEPLDIIPGQINYVDSLPVYRLYVDRQEDGSDKTIGIYRNHHPAHEEMMRIRPGNKYADADYGIETVELR